MRTTITSMLFIALGYALNAQQLTFLPQIGIENNRTSIRFNDLPSFSPMQTQISPQLGARLDYTFKKNHGPFVGISTSRSVVSYNFANPQTGMNVYKASTGNLRLDVEGGYHMSTKRMYFSKNSPAPNPVQVNPEKPQTERRCGSYLYKMHNENNQAKKDPVPSKEKGWYISLQPFIGAALASPINPDVSMQTQGSNYKYEAGNWNSALVTGTGLEFGKNVDRKFTVYIQYLKGIGNLGTRSISSTMEGKTVNTDIRSGVSAWRFTAGIPITLYKKKTVVKQQPAIKKDQNKPNADNPYKRKCWQYKSRCTRVI